MIKIIGRTNVHIVQYGTTMCAEVWDYVPGAENKHLVTFTTTEFNKLFSR